MTLISFYIITHYLQIVVTKADKVATKNNINKGRQGRGLFCVFWHHFTDFFVFSEVPYSVLPVNSIAK